MFSESYNAEIEKYWSCALKLFKNGGNVRCRATLKARYLAQVHINGLVERKTGLRCRVTEALIPAGLAIC